MKRLFDFTAALFGLLLVLPLFAGISLLILLQGDGPVFFTQIRIGRYLKPFVLYKFRSMRPSLSAGDLQITTADNPRITPLGRVLRRTKLDELPQLLNVLKGDMSLVGPRPEVRRFVSLYREEFRRVLQIRPGITDPASLESINEELELQNQTDPERYYLEVLLPHKLRVSLAYAERATLWTDLGLVMRTLGTLLGGHRKRP
ncbi:MAG: sugar transferase [Deltaproteobacteria bacterium]|nr:sugar transferase [Deltaproteobacteria bacterium]